MRDQQADQDIHQRGAAAFGTRWLAVNAVLVELCQKQSIRVWKEPWHTVLPQIAWAWCEDLRSIEHKNEAKERTNGTD